MSLEYGNGVDGIIGVAIGGYFHTGALLAADGLFEVDEPIGFVV